jgi:ABC-type glycerol-3-phosphate transport system substrate-binding protein
MSGNSVAAGTEQKEEAGDFLAFAISEEGASISAESGSAMPSNLAALHSDAFLQPGEQPKNAQVFVDAVHRSDVTPFVPGWEGVIKATSTDVERMFYEPGILDLDKLLPLMDEQSQRILAPPAQ